MADAHATPPKKQKPKRAKRKRTSLKFPRQRSLSHEARKHVGPPDGEAMKLIRRAAQGRQGVVETDLAPTEGTKSDGNPIMFFVLREKAKELNVDPFEVLLMFAGNLYKKLGYDSEVPQSYRLTAAKEATKYLYPQLRAIEVSGPDGQPVGLADKIRAAERVAKLLDILTTKLPGGFTRPGMVVEATPASTNDGPPPTTTYRREDPPGDTRPNGNGAG